MWLFLTAALLVFAIVLFKYPRQTIYLLGGLVVVVVVGVFYNQRRENQKYDEVKAREANVSISVTYDTKSCKPEFPLLTIISNRSSLVVNRVQWRWSAFAPGRSTDLIQYRYINNGTSDHILQPNTMGTLCYKVPELTEKIDPATLQWSTERDSVDFAGD